jgi:hypothetical protein
MTLRKAPRELYRVYDEDEFFACAPDEPFRQDVQAKAASGARQPHRVGAHRWLVGTALLVGLGAFSATVAFGGANNSNELGHRVRRRLSSADNGVRALIAGVTVGHPRDARNVRIYRQLRVVSAQSLEATHRRHATRRHLPARPPHPPASSPPGATEPDRASVPAPAVPRPESAAAFVASSSRRSGRVEFGFEQRSAGR